jgi:hypothetical protein
VKLTDKAIRQGSLNSGKLSTQRKEKRIEQYLVSPKYCKCCTKVIDYNNRRKIFCNSSCSATFNNLQKIERTVPLTWNCVYCSKNHVTIKWRPGTYCNNNCQHAHQNKERVRQWLEEGINWGMQVPKWVKRYLIEQRGHACEICRLSTWLENDITLECDHIDGNHNNNVPLNLRLLCPNCHSQTPTYKAKNLGSGRASRRVV